VGKSEIGYYYPCFIAKYTGEL